jgi:uncharacterized MAPEG superfamily protein
MPTELRLLAYSAILTWLMIVVASGLKANFDLATMFGNREALPTQTPLAGRAQRAASNMLENLVLFVAVTLATAAAHGHHDRIVLGARVFFWARLAYWPVYLAGIPYLRTVCWLAGVVGMGLMLSAAL